MLRIYLARHGQDQDNANGILNGRRDMPLTEKGIAQAHESAQKIRDAGIRFDHIYSSPLQRAYTTACIIAETLDTAPPEKLPLLLERDFGIMTGKPVNSIKELCSPDILQTEVITYFLHPEGAETFPDVLERARQLLLDLNARHPDGDILLVTHGDLGKMVYAAYYHLDWLEVLKLFHFGNTELLELSPTSSAEDTHVFRIEQHNH